MPTTPAVKKRAPAQTWDGTLVRVVTPTTAIVEVSSVKEHPKYRKRYVRSTRYLVHVSSGQTVTVGQKVAITPTRPRSGGKHWRLV